MIQTFQNYYILLFLDFKTVYIKVRMGNKCSQWLHQTRKKCSTFLRSWTGFLNVPQFCAHNLINTLNIMCRIILKRANKEQLRMICILKLNLHALKSKYAGDCSKCSSIWSFWKMFLRIQDPKIPVFSRSESYLVRINRKQNS